MKQIRGRFAIAALAAVTALALASCGGSSSSGGSSGGGKEGGTLHGTYASFPDYLDPALSYTQEGWLAMYDTYIPLLTYAHASGEAGSKVIPGLAKALPKVSDGGKTYTLFLRPGLKYSDGKPVEASDFTHSLERVFKLSSGGSPFYTDIVGAEEFAETKKGGIPGIETDDKSGEIVIHLVRPRGTFVNELAIPFAALLPGDTPVEDMSANPPPATGPYVITKSQPGRGWEYERNPYWAKANAKAMPELPSGHVDKIKIDVIHNSATQVNDVENGKYQWMQPPPAPDQYAQIKRKYDGTQFRVESTISTYYFWMNTTKPPFNDPKVRQAVNYAVDGEALERVYAGQLEASQQILPPGMPGYKKLDLYPYDLAKAKQMIREANPSDRNITVWTNDEPENREAGEYYEGQLSKIGFHTKLKAINASNYWATIGNRSTPDLDTGWSDWFEDYPHPNDFFQPLLSGESILPNNNGNLANIDVPRLNRKIAKLGEETLGPEQEAGYAELDREYMELAPWAPYGNRTETTFVSDEINLENVVFNLTFGQDLTSFEFK